jgi:DnaJ-domain-containing protein 1
MAAASKAGADMTAVNNSGAAGIVALALEFHRAPTRHADLLHGRAPLPRGVGILLKLAGGSEPDPEWGDLAAADELQAAALFFIEQVLFRHGSDHYRVLGVEPGSSPEQIKEHHRLLMRVFHPDRENRADDWKDAFATRINLAYSALRDPHTRRDYDATLNPATRPATKLVAARRARSHQPKSALSRSRTSGLPPLLLRYLPQWVLAGAALIAVIGVGTVYLNNPPASARRAQEVALRAEASIPDHFADARAEEKPSLALELPLRSPATQPGVAVQMKVPAPIARPELAAGTVNPPVRAERLPGSITHTTQPENPAPPTPAVIERPPAGPDTVQRPLPSPAIEVVAVVEPVVPAVQQPAVLPAQPMTSPASEATARPGQPDPDATLAKFMASFERGDTQALMALFDDVAIGRAGGKSSIRREHETLFRSTELRHIDIDGMAWSREGDWIRGEGRYRTTLMRKGELLLRTETGVFRIQLVRHGDQALIMGLDLQPGGRS